MDHHCLFVLKCIAGLNQRAFVLLLTFVLFGNLMFLSSTSIYWMSAFSSIHLALKHSWDYDFWTLAMVLGNVLCICWTGSMLLYQLEVISHKTSTVYRLKNKNTLQSKKKMKVVERLKTLMHFMKTGVRDVSDNKIAIYWVPNCNDFLSYNVFFFSKFLSVRMFYMLLWKIYVELIYVYANLHDNFNQGVAM